MSSTGARHTYRSYLLANGVDIWAVAKLMGHKDIKQFYEILYLIFDYPHKHYTFKYFEV